MDTLPVLHKHFKTFEVSSFSIEMGYLMTCKRLKTNNPQKIEIYCTSDSLKSAHHILFPISTTHNKLGGEGNSYQQCTNVSNFEYCILDISLGSFLVLLQAPSTLYKFTTVAIGERRVLQCIGKNSCPQWRRLSCMAGHL